MISGTTGDPDLWGHVRFGQDILAHRSIHLPDVYSFTADRAWINHEWLAEVLMAVAFNQFGAAGLNLLRIATAIVVLALVWRATVGLASDRRVMLVALAALGIYLRAHPIRPQMFSLVMFAILLTLLKRVDDDRSVRSLVGVPVVMIAWVNLHGGWVVGLGFFALWVVTHLNTIRDKRVALGCALALAVASTLVNPYGVGMWHFLIETVRPDRPMIADWQPLYKLPLLLWMSWLAGLGTLAIATRPGILQANWLRVALVAALGIAAIRVSRIDAFFALAAVFLATSLLPKAQPASPHSNRVRSSPLLAMLLLACVVPVGFLVKNRISAIPVPSYLMPDASVAAYVRVEYLQGKVLTWFDWGQYTIWHFGPGLKVSMDGRRETVYSAAVVNAHMRFYFGSSNEWRYADAIGADYVWIPKGLPIALELPLHGWHRLCEGQTSVLFAREPRQRRCPENTPTGDRLFPQL
jgi:hypothetical protein